jgi:hypothetical protein
VGAVKRSVPDKLGTYGAVFDWRDVTPQAKRSPENPGFKYATLPGERENCRV